MNLVVDLNQVYHFYTPFVHIMLLYNNEDDDYILHLVTCKKAQRMKCSILSDNCMKRNSLELNQIT